MHHIFVSARTMLIGKFYSSLNVFISFYYEIKSCLLCLRENKWQEVAFFDAVRIVEDIIAEKYPGLAIPMFARFSLNVSEA
jgi:hypothetical protein